MKGYLALIASLAVWMCPAKVEGYLHPEPGHFGLTGAFLYLHPLFDQSYYVIQNNNTSPVSLDPYGKRYENNMGWQGAFRLEAVYGLTCDPSKEIHCDWTHFSAGNTVSRNGLLQGTQGFAFVGFLNFPSRFNGFAESSLYLTCDAVDLFLSQCLFRNCAFDFSLMAGLGYAALAFSEKVTYRGIPNLDTTLLNQTTRNQARVWGVGPEFGLSGAYSIGTLFARPNFPLNLNVHLLTAFLVSESTSQSRGVLYNVATGAYEAINSPKNEEKWRIVPYWDMRGGLSYLVECGCLSANVEIGYELISFRNAIQTTVYSAHFVPPMSTDLYSDLDFHGPYVELGITF